MKENEVNRNRIEQTKSFALPDSIRTLSIRLNRTEPHLNGYKQPYDTKVVTLKCWALSPDQSNHCVGGVSGVLWEREELYPNCYITIEKGQYTMQFVSKNR